MYNVVIVEDDESAAAHLKSHLVRYAEEEKEEFNISCYYSGMLFLENYKPVYDLVFMDIVMPEFNGMETAKQMREYDENTCLIFVTNMSQYAINGYEVGAADFIIKPVNYFQFSLKLKKVLKKLSNGKTDTFFIKYENEFKKLRYNDVLYVEVQNHWLIYHCRAEQIRVRGSLSKIKDDMVSHGFVQSNSCYLINLDYIENISENTVTVGKDRLQISHSRKKSFLSSLANHMSGCR